MPENDDLTDGLDELAVDSCRVFRDEKFASLIVFALEVASSKHPEILKDALANILDLSAIEETYRRILVALSETQRMAAEARQTAQEARDLIGQVMEDLQLHADQIHHRLDQAAKLYKRMANGEKK